MDNLSLEKALRSRSQNQCPEGEGEMAKEGVWELQNEAMSMPLPQVQGTLPCHGLPMLPAVKQGPGGQACCATAEQGGIAAVGRAASHAGHPGL